MDRSLTLDPKHLLKSRRDHVPQNFQQLSAAPWQGLQTEPSAESTTRSSETFGGLSLTGLICKPSPQMSSSNLYSIGNSQPESASSVNFALTTQD